MPDSIDQGFYFASAWNYKWSKGYGSPTSKSLIPMKEEIDEAK